MEPVAAAPAEQPEIVAPANGAAEPPETGGLTAEEINDLRARLAKAAARKRGSN